MTTADASPARALGLVAASALVVGNMIGSGVFLLPAALAAYGGVGLAGWIASGTGAVLLALVFAHLARARPASGGPYAYARLAFGDFAGFLVAWGYWISTLAGNAALATAGVGYLEPFIPAVVHRPVSAALLAAGFVWIFALVNLRSVRSVGQIQVVSTIIKVLPLGLVGIGGLIYFQPAHFAIATHGLAALGHDVSATATLTLFAFLGLESATIPTRHVVDPDRTIPRATVIGTMATGVLCLVGTIGVMSVVAPSTLAHSTAPFADAAGLLAGNWARLAIALAGAVSCLGALNGWTLLVAELPRAAAEDGVFPRLFGTRTAHGTPVVGMAISALLTTVLIALNATQTLVAVFTFVILLSTLGTLVPYAFTALAGFLIPQPDGQPITRSLGAQVVAVLAFAFSIWAIAGAGTDVVYWGFLALLAGVPVFVWRGAAAVPGRLEDPS